MKLTDEKVAKALGWVEVRERRTAHGRVRLSGFDGKSLGKTPYNVPAFTTSLDSITREIEARRLYWEIRRVSTNGYRVRLHKGGMNDRWLEYHCADTAPVALCAALLAYLKEKP